MKKIIFLTLLLCAVTLVPYTASAQWVAPTATPPNGNVPAPINVGVIAQEKPAGLTIGGITLTVPTGYNALGVKNRTTNQQVFGVNPYGIAGQGYFSIWGSKDGASWLSLITGKDGKVGIGGGTTPKIPVEALDVAGAVKIGTTATANAGTIRWTGQDFEGFKGTTEGWASLTAQGTGGGNDVVGTCPAGQFISKIATDGTIGCSTPSATRQVDFSPAGFSFSLPTVTVGATGLVYIPANAPAPKEALRAVVISLSLKSAGTNAWNHIKLEGYNAKMSPTWQTVGDYVWSDSYSKYAGVSTGVVNSPTFIVPVLATPNSSSKAMFRYFVQGAGASGINGQVYVLGYIYDENPSQTESKIFSATLIGDYSSTGSENCYLRYPAVTSGNDGSAGSVGMNQYANAPTYVGADNAACWDNNDVNIILPRNACNSSSSAGCTMNTSVYSPFFKNFLASMATKHFPGAVCNFVDQNGDNKLLSSDFTSARQTSSDGGGKTWANLNVICTGQVTVAK